MLLIARQMQRAESQFQVRPQQCFISQGKSVCAARVEISCALRMTLIAADQRPPVARSSRVQSRELVTHRRVATTQMSCPSYVCVLVLASIGASQYRYSV